MSAFCFFDSIFSDSQSLELINPPNPSAEGEGGSQVTNSAASFAIHQMKEHIHLRDKVVHIIHDIDVERSTAGLEDLFLQLAYRVYPGPTPPEYVYHVAQVATVTDIELSNTDKTEQEWGKRYAWSHDVGRAVDMGQAHTRGGARILREYGFSPSLVTYALAHHRWGLGIPLLAVDSFPLAVGEALANGNVEHIMMGIMEKRGIAALAVLLADNSKQSIKQGSFETEIAPFSLEHAQTLIDIQIQRGRYLLGSREHAMDELGARFLSAMVPHLELRLGVKYANVIFQAQQQWQSDKEKVLAKWRDIHYDQQHDFKIL